MRIPRIHLRHTALVLVVLVASCGGGGSPSAPATTPTANPTPTPTPASTATADLVITIVGDIGGMSFSPAAATVRVGQTVAWRNSDTDFHTATQDARRFDTGTLARGATSAPLAMTTAGAMTYHCTFHPDMVGTLTVAP
jgi:plastocyanin